jgi:hypothetical protein
MSEYRDLIEKKIVKKDFDYENMTESKLLICYENRLLRILCTFAQRPRGVVAAWKRSLALHRPFQPSSIARPISARRPAVREQASVCLERQQITHDKTRRQIAVY